MERRVSRGYLSQVSGCTCLPRCTSKLASHLIVRKLLALVGTHEPVHTKEEDVPLIGVLLELSDFQSGLDAQALDASHDSEARCVRGGLAAIEQLVVITAGKFFNLVFEQRRHYGSRDKVAESEQRP